MTSGFEPCNISAVNGPGKGSSWASVGGLAITGTVMGVCVALGLAGGYWLDRKLGTGPWLAVVGLLVGVAAAFRELLRAVRSARRDRE
ncbi:MAG: AtpZ/AtpI family protein [Armatimonadetes bacterium]|nr:AtpZ/AtpI family protein [Armatimonadota bacterium]